jgi:hypothetical protein
MEKRVTFTSTPTRSGQRVIIHPHDPPIALLRRSQIPVRASPPPRPLITPRPFAPRALLPPPPRPTVQPPTAQEAQEQINRGLAALRNPFAFLTQRNVEAPLLVFKKKIVSCYVKSGKHVRQTVVKPYVIHKDREAEFERFARTIHRECNCNTKQYYSVFYSVREDMLFIPRSVAGSAAR